MSTHCLIRPRTRPPIQSLRDSRLPDIAEIDLLPRTTQITVSALGWFKGCPLGLEIPQLAVQAEIDLLTEHFPCRLDAATARVVAMRLSERLLVALTAMAEDSDGDDRDAAVDARHHVLACRSAIRATRDRRATR